MSFSEWKLTKLGDILTLNYGKGLPQKKRVAGNIPVYSSAGITGWHNEALVPKEGIIVGRKGTVGSVYYSNSPFFCIDTAYFITKEDTDQNLNYIYYLLKYLPLVKLNTDSAVPGLNRDNAYSQNLKLPSIEEQKSIAYILSTLDDKIEVNHKINDNLEQMAQAIFKQWFVDFEFPNEDDKPYKSSGGEMVESELGMIPRRWKIETLGEILTTIESGNRPKGGVGNLTEGIPSIGAENIIGLGKYEYSKEKFVTEKYFNKMNKGIVKSGDVLLYKDGAQLGRKTMFMDGFPHKRCGINSHVFILRTNKLISQSYLYFWLDQGYMTQNIINLNANSAQPGINQVQIKTLKILIPDKDSVDKFDNIITCLLKKIYANCNINNRLANLRDTLLPKLMSGEIDVSDLKLDI